MGSTSACAAEESFVAAYGLPYKLDMKSFGGQKSCKLDEFRSLSGSSEGVLADLGLATTGSARDADSFKIHSVLSKANTMHTLANPVDMKASKKHDKALPCPRCNSLDTKFCYYNNYNVNQPRHFCKGCQRYWTAGGTLRNVAIGAGRRKRKHASLESDSQDSALEDCSSHDLPVKVSGSAESGSAMDKFAHGTSQFMKHQVFPFERIQGAALSYPPAPKVKKSSVSEYTHTNELVIPHDKVVPLSNSQSLKEQARTFYEYLRPKHMEAQLDNAKIPGNVRECARDVIDVEHVKMKTFNVHMDLRHNECNSVGSKLISTTSSEMQVSNESGCVSSLTTQAVSADACVTDGKSDGMDSEVTKEGDELHKGGSYVSTILQTAHISPCKAHMDGSRLATSSFVHRDSNSVATIAPIWKGLPENPALKPAWTMISAAPTWGPPADNTHTWGFPWGPASNAVDAAKAALIPTAGASQKHLAEPTCIPEMRLWVPKTLRIKDADEAARSSIWSTLGIKDRQGSVLSEKVEAVFQCHAKEGGARSTQLQHTSPVALTQSMAFQESS